MIIADSREGAPNIANECNRRLSVAGSKEPSVACYSRIHTHVAVCRSASWRKVSGKTIWINSSRSKNNSPRVHSPERPLF